MGAYNTLIADSYCPNCNYSGILDVQMKFGDCWQFEYRIGDTVRWGGNDKDDRLKDSDPVRGIGQCPSCARYIDFHIIVDGDVLLKCEPINGP